MQRMRFWLVAVLMSGPVFLVSVLVRMLAWLVILSALVTWWGPGDAASDPVGGLAGLVGGLVLWAVATLPRWAAFKLGAWVRL